MTHVIGVRVPNVESLGGESHDQNERRFRREVDRGFHAVDTALHAHDRDIRGQAQKLSSKITVSPDEPDDPALNDVWIDTTAATVVKVWTGASWT